MCVCVCVCLYVHINMYTVECLLTFHHATIQNLQVVVLQAYKNNSSTPIEAKYVFPLDDMAAGTYIIQD